MGTVVGSWRLKIIIILILFATCMYGLNAIFGSLGSEGYINEEGYFDYNHDIPDIEYNETEIGVEQSNNFMDAVGGLGDFLTFGSIDNIWARLFLNICMSVVWIVITYLAYTFIKEFIPFV